MLAALVVAGPGPRNGNTVLPHEECRLVQLSIQSTHVHLLVEAEHSWALSRGMQAFQISAA